jgi:hypothetical protein
VVFRASCKCAAEGWLSTNERDRFEIEDTGDEAMRITKLIFASILAIFLTGFCSKQLQAQDTMPTSSTSMKDMKPADSKDMTPQMEKMHAQMEEMRTQMAQLQALMKDAMEKMAAADAAMKVHMETEQASMKSQMALQQAVIDHLQTMNDHMQTMKDCMAMMPGAMDTHKKSGTKMKQDKSMTGDQK